MNDRVEGTDKSAQRKTITFTRTINTGNYENRRYSIEAEVNGASFHEVISMLEQDILEREAMYEHVESLEEKIKRLEQKIDSVKSRVLLARKAYSDLEKNLINPPVTEEEQVNFLAEWERLKNLRDGANRDFDQLFKFLDIDPETDSEDDEFPW